MTTSSFSLAGRVALVTGAGRGIGRAIALALAEADANLVLTARSQDEIDEVAQEVRERFGVDALAVNGDQTITADVERIVDAAKERFGAIDILVNNAGQPVDGPFLEASEDDTRALIDVNLLGPIRFLQAAGRLMVGRGQGKVINIASIDAVVGMPRLAIYGATKGAIAALTKALAAEWARHGVTVNAVCPGYIQTAANTHALADEKTRAKVTGRIPLRRLGQPEDVAGITVYLASGASDFVTGSMFVVDGGETAV